MKQIHIPFFLLGELYMTEKEKELTKQITELKELLKETLNAMCSFRASKGHCSICNDKPFCTAKKIIPKVENVLNIKH